MDKILKAKQILKPKKKKKDVFISPAKAEKCSFVNAVLMEYWKMPKHLICLMVFIECFATIHLILTPGFLLPFFF